MHCEIRPATAVDVPMIAELANTIWHEHYPSIISVQQIDYMLAQRYNADVLEAQLHQAGHWFDILYVDQIPSGFAHYFLCQNDEAGAAAVPEMKLDKLYLLPTLHGKGYGSRMLHHVKKCARAAGCHTLLLAVNKNNKKAVDAYLRNGFEVRESTLVDIGNGFVMDDYVMAQRID